MKTIFANDTSGTSNPGCQGTTAMLHALIENDVDIISRLPVSYRYHQPPPPAPPTPNLAQRGFNKLSRLVTQPPAPDPHQAENEWRKMLPGLTAKLEPLWKDAELLLINAEGTIHHDAAGAQMLIALCAAARAMGKRTALVNGSIFELDNWLLEALKENVDIISVREPVSHRYLSKHGITAHQSADCLFLSHGNPQENTPIPKTPYAIYTPGVLSGTGSVSEEVISEDIRKIASTGREVYYYVVESEDEPLARIAANSGAKIIPLGGLEWHQVTALLKGADLVISGRYHINIYAALAGTPFIPMETNTSKMSGLLELLQAPENLPVRAWNNSAGAPHALDLNATVQVSPETLKHCAELARKTQTHLFPELQQ